jgi:hypothetical protein
VLGVRIDASRSFCCFTAIRQRPLGSSGGEQRVERQLPIGYIVAAFPPAGDVRSLLTTVTPKAR